MKKLFRESLPETLGGGLLMIIVAALGYFKDLPLFLQAILILLIILSVVIYYLLSNFDITERIGKTFGFIYEDYQMTFEMNLDGGFTCDAKYVVKSLNKLGSRVELMSLTGNSKFKNMQIDLNGGNNKYNVSYELISESKQLSNCKIKFSPAIKNGDSVEYSLSYKSKSGFLTTYEDVADQIQQKVWSLSEPYEFAGIGVKYPTKKISLTLIFPKGYNIYGTDFWDVRLADGSERVDEIYEKIKSKSLFTKYNNQEGQICLTINYENPIIGTKYYLKFQPPGEEERNSLKANT